MSPDKIIAHLGLCPHPEGGWYRETWRAEAVADARPSGTAIYFLLKAGERSHWHKVDSAELWLWHAGAPLDLSIAATASGPAKVHRLGPDLAAGAAPQVLVPPHHWQAATTTATTAHGFTLVSCVVSPGFSFDGFTLAAPDFDIPQSET